MKSRIPLFLTVMAVLLTTARYANADTPPDEPTNPIKPINSYYNLHAAYIKRLAFIDNRHLELKITLIPVPGGSIPAEDRITLAGVRALDNREINISQTSGGPDNNVYIYNVDLSGKLEPRTYKLTLEFQSPRN